MSNPNITRRQALRKGTAAATVGGLGITSNASVSAEKDSGVDWEISGVDWMERSGVAKNLKYAFSHSYAGKLKKKLQSEGFRPAPNKAAAAAIKTTSAKVNATNPVQVLVPFVSRGGPSKDKPAKQYPGGKDKSDGGTSDDLKGLLIATVAGEKNDKQLLGGLATVLDNSGTEPTTKIIGNIGARNAEPEVGVIQESPAEDSQFKTSQSLGCATCNILLGNICGIVTGKLTNAVCLKTGAICFAGTGMNIPAALGCLGACYLVVGAVSAYACFYGVSYACNNIKEVNC